MDDFTLPKVVNDDLPRQAVCTCNTNQKCTMHFNLDRFIEMDASKESKVGIERESSYIERMLSGVIFKEEYPTWLGGAILSYLDQMSQITEKEYINLINEIQIRKLDELGSYTVKLGIPGGMMVNVFHERDYSE